MSLIVNEADEIVKQRAGEYGEPVRYFTGLEMIEQILRDYAEGSPHQVPGALSVLQKIALKLMRLAYDPTHKDSILDLKGYTKILEECVKHGKTK